MDPATLALMMAPTMMSMLNRGPSQPGANMYGGVEMPDRSRYADQLLASGFNPNSELYRIASERALAATNQNLINKGMGYSTAGNQAISGAQSDLANKFLESEVQRRIAAFNAVTGNDLNRARLQMGLAEGQMGQEWKRYQGDMAAEQGFYQGLGDLGSIGAGYLGRQQQQQKMDAADARNQANFDRYMKAMEGTRAQSGGMYSAAPVSPLGYSNNYGIR